MNSSGFLYTVIERIRAYLDDGDVDAKFSNDFIVRHIITPATVDVMSRISNTTEAPIILKYAFTISAGVGRYRLPPNVQSIWRLVEIDEDGVYVGEYRPYNFMHWEGPGWRVEGVAGCMELVLDDPINTSKTMQLWYTPNGDFMPLYGTASVGDTLTSTVTIESVTLGEVDRRVNAYAGGIFRWIPDASTYPGERISEGIISASSYTGGYWTLTLANDIVVDTAAVRNFEITMPGSQALYEAISTWGAMKLAVHRKITKNHHDMLRTQYLAALKTICDNATNAQVRTPAAFEKLTVDRVWALGDFFQN